MESVPEYIDYSEQSILFSRADHPTAVPKPGHAALVLEPSVRKHNEGNRYDSRYVTRI
jgi:hypothetical protein